MIFYFSGTGNSAWVARQLARLTGDDACDITTLKELPDLDSNRQIGFVFPVYAWGTPEIMAEFAKKLPKPQAFTFGVCTCGGDAGLAMKQFSDYHEMFASGLIDAVLIATPHYLHPTIAIDGFAAGLHVLTEKPAGVYTNQVQMMNDAAKASDRVFGIMYNQRTNPQFQKIREIIKSGRLGECKRLIWIITNWYRTQAYYDSGTWRATWAGEGGGVLINQCPHNLDLWQWMFGMPTRVRATCHYGKWHNIEVEDEVTAYAEYANGASAVFITTTGEAPGTNRLEVTGDRGKVEACLEALKPYGILETAGSGQVALSRTGFSN